VGATVPGGGVNYEAYKPALKAWASAITQLPESHVVFMNDPQPRAAEKMVYLNVRGTRSLGVGDRFQSYDETAKEITETHSGSREILLTFQVDSYDMRAAGNALSLINKAVTRMRLDSSMAILEAAGLALATADDPVDASYAFDKRMVSRYSMDVVLNATSSETDAPVPTIESVEITGEPLGAAGNVLPE
jgi:hypothetical protein